MYFQYGSYRHPDNEVNLESYDVEAQFSPRGLRSSTIFRMRLKGVFPCSTQAECDARIQELINAYALDGQGDAVLYHDDGSPTQYVLQENHPSAITGVRVLARSWPEGGPVEYATQRTFSLLLESELADESSAVLDWHESLRFIGNCGPQVEVVELATGDPIDVQVKQKTTQKIIQSGWSWGTSGYVLPFGSLWPDSEHQEQQISEPISPKLVGRGFRYFGWKWSYFHTRKVYTVGLPTSHP
jgi:hypothetical protein